MNDENNSPWQNLGGRQRTIISYVKSPLGFYTLALLIVEGFLLGGGAMLGLSEIIRITILGTGVLLFLAVIGVVTVLVIRYPKSLVFSEESHIQWESMRVFGDSTRPMPEKTITVMPGS